MAFTDWEGYLDSCERFKDFPIFMGYEPFEHLLERGRIVPESSVLKVKSMGIPPTFIDYHATGDGMLRKISDNGQPVMVSAKMVLSSKWSPEGWWLYNWAPAKTQVAGK